MIVQIFLFVFYISRIIPIIFLSSFFIAAPFLKYFFLTQYSVDAQRIAQLIIMASFLPFVIFKHVNKNTFIAKNLFTPIVALSVLATISALSSPHPRSAVLEIGMITSCLLILSNSAYYFFPLHSRDSLLWIAAIIVISTSITIKHSLGAYINWLAQDYSSKLTPFDLTSGYSNPRFLNSVQVITLCFFPLIISIIRQKLAKNLLTILAGAWLALLLMTHGRGAMISWVLSIFIIHLIYRQKSIKWVKKSLSILMLGLVLYVFMGHIIPNIYHHNGINNENFWKIGQKEQRLDLWNICLTLIRKHPWFGIGPMELSLKKYGINGHPHNFILQIATEMGIPAAALTIWIIFQALFTEIKVSRRESTLPIRHVSTMAAVIASLMYSMLSGAFIYPMGQTWFFLTLGWAYANNIHLSTSIYHKNTVLVPKVLMIIIILTATASVLQGIWPEAKNIDQKLSAYCVNHRSECDPLRSPRMWSVAEFTIQQS
ncbi:O-antigen ligase family protein [Candidatus Ichthyocystis hellenicum]|nr:O-antigen ligase family protein [Candidatus Ichthyocystis hellenicum]